MPSLAEIQRSLHASVLLARGDQSGRRLFDTTMDGFWRSFAAIVLIVPMAIFSVAAELSIAAEYGAPARASALDFHLVRFFSLGLDWVAFPLAMVPIASLLALGRNYAAFIIVYNWTSVLIEAVLLVPVLLYLVGLLPAGLALILNLAATLWALWFRYTIARTILEASAPSAVALAVFDFVLSLTIALGGEAALLSDPVVPEEAF